MEVFNLKRAGRYMSVDEARRLESSVELNPDDVNARIKLIAFYFGQRTYNRRPRENACRHIFWLMRKDPTHSVFSMPEARPHYDTASDDLYQEGAELWNEQIINYPNNAAVLTNAAYFFYHLNWDQAITLLETALTLEPENVRIKDRLAFTCELAARTDKSDMRLRRAFDLRAELLSAKEPGENLRELVDLAESAYRLNDFDKCRVTAEQVLQNCAPLDCNGDEFHQANQLMGLVQLIGNDCSGACLSLLRSAEVKSTPVLSSFGPKFKLAKELLKKGERTTVLRYLRDCSVFWNSGQRYLTYWWVQIQLGRTTELNSQRPVELFIPWWTNVPATWFMTFVRTSSQARDVTGF